MKTQSQIIKDKLVEDGRIDNKWAIEHYIWRLGARISDLRQSGWKIDGDFKRVKGKKTKVFEYYLVGKNV